MKNIVYIATSLDGLIADKDGGIDWLMEMPNPQEDDYGYADFISQIDALVMGRKTFEKVLSFGGEWPYEKPVFVLSTTLSEIPENLTGKAELINGSIKKIVNQLSEKGYENLYIDGGKTIQSFLEEDLIDELIITTVPILLGDGYPLFSKLSKPLKFTHKSTKSFDNGLTQTHYTKNRP